MARPKRRKRRKYVRKSLRRKKENWKSAPDAQRTRMEATLKATLKIIQDAQ